MGAAATTSHNAAGGPVGDLLFFIHGYWTGPEDLMTRHRVLQKNLRDLGYKGAVLSFDWPSEDNVLAYVEDRIDARKTALQLVSDGIAVLCRALRPNCQINIHILAHSMGAFVLREAFDDADDRGGVIGGSNWTASQVLLIAADISMRSLEADGDCEALYTHSVRLTNYSNSHDGALALSNVKRIGLAPRAGRHGLPDEAPQKAVNVDCSDYWKTIPDGQPVLTHGHSWHIGDPVFTQDMLLTISGVDRGSMPTREPVGKGRFKLRRPA